MNRADLERKADALLSYNIEGAYAALRDVRDAAVKA